MELSTPHEGTLDEARAWALLLALSERASAGGLGARASGYRLDADGRLEEVPPERGWLALDPAREGAFSCHTKLSPAVAELFELYLPLCVASEGGSRVFAHVGQSLDGQIAVETGASRYVSGPENLRHMHRLRALADAVIVGAGTVECDDPRLTTRLVPGRNPTRVVIDPKLRLPRDRHVFEDGAAPTLVLCARRQGDGAARIGQATPVELEEERGVLPPRAIVRALRERGLRRLFIEGGGVTVSRFIEARTLDRLHVTICPLIIGRGRPGIALPPVDRLERALRPRTRRFQQGEDVLFDCAMPRDEE